MKIQARAILAYDLSIGGKPLGKFDVVSEWEGMVKLKSSKGDIIIAHRHSSDDGVFTALFETLNDTNSDKELVPIKASPGLLDEFTVV